ncbi:MAG TPA: sugar phosphate isomerase/epimerase [Candidatus Sulfopaludibacter sp.]|jgi:inosose dehydratase|nr:sugar phosphate isomerase/epimerase [Candidatus Sulfopaludibacter sp.]
MDRRNFLGSLGAALGLAGTAAKTAFSAPNRRLKIGHTGITWGYKPDDAEQAIHDIGSLGYAGYESFGEVIEAWEAKGGIKRLLDAAQLPLISAYCNVNLTDPTKRKDDLDKIVRWAKLIQKCGGVTAVVGPNGLRRSTYDFKAAKADIVTSLNEMCKAVSDVGIIPALHQHTGTCIESRDEVYAILEAVDTRYVKFGPDVGQLAKGGSDPVKIVKDFLPIIRHVHLKDWDGGPYWTEYCPVGKGKVDMKSVMDLLEQAPDLKIVMVELDPSANAPMPPIETARVSKEYLKSLGYSFRV